MLLCDKLIPFKQLNSDEPAERKCESGDEAAEYRIE